MADLINYNGYQIAPGAVNDPVKQLMQAQGLLPSQDVLDEAAMNMTGSPEPQPVFDQSGQMVGIQGSPQAVEGMNPVMDQGQMIGMVRGPAMQTQTPLLPEPAMEQLPEDQGEAAATQAPPVNPYADYIDSRKRAAELQVAGAEREAGALGDMAQRSMQSADELEQIRARFNQDVQEMEQKRDDMYKEYDERDIKSYWDTKSGGQKLLAAISIAAGSLGAGLSGGNNDALRIIENDIKRHMELEEARLNKLKDKADRMNTAIGIARQKFGDNLLASQQVSNLYRQQALDKVAQIKAQTTSDVARANLEGLETQIMQEINKTNAEILKSKAQSFKTLSEAQKLQAEASKLEGTAGEPPQEILERFVPGVGVALDKGAATKLREEGAAVYEALPIINDLLDVTEEDFRSLSPVKRAEIAQKVSILTGKLRIPVVGPGAFTDSERAFIRDEIVGNPGALFSIDASTRRKLQELKGILGESRDAKIRATGVRPFNAQEQAYANRLIGATSAPPQTKQEQQSDRVNQSIQYYQRLLQQDPNNAEAQQALDGLFRLQSGGM